jgi:hypothetical protein
VALAGALMVGSGGLILARRPTRHELAA